MQADGCLLCRRSYFLVTGVGVFQPVASVTCGIQVLHRRVEVLVDPWVVSVIDTVLLANFTNLGGNVGVPCRTHTREQMMFHLEVKTTSDVSRDGTTVSATGFNLGLEPVNLFTSLTKVSRGITIGIDKVVRERKGESQSQTFRDTHNRNVEDGSLPVMVQKGCNNIGNNVQQPQGNGPLSASDDEVIIESHTDTSSTTLVQIQNLRIEHRRDPVTSHDGSVKETLEFVHKGSCRMSKRVIVEN
mmetsp:Transcript_15275/g.20124  ORF Transcript_15275/g.20124 Transcript_15275/m.20124 type:complete len:244 (-) Transcript_15275:818-1549(-)